jgi:uncharacterized protein
MNFLTGSNDLGTLGLGLLIAGAAAGLFGGILGRGAGLILVSALFLVARSAGIGTDLAMHLAVGTSFACLLPLSLGLLAAHGRSLDWDLARRWAVWLIAGTAAGLAVALRLPGAQLALVFAAVAVAAAAMAVGVKDRESVKPSSGLFGNAMAFVTGTTAGALGLSGAALGNPLLALCGLLRARAEATAALFAVVITAAGAIVMAASGYGLAGLPKYSYGYVNLLAFGATAPVAFATSLIGARFAPEIDTKRLRLLFAVVALWCAARVVWNVVG